MNRKSLPLLTLLLASLASNAYGTELVHQFKNPSFSGQGAGAQWLTIENQEFTRKKAINDKLEAARSALESDNRLTDFNMVCLLRGEAAAWRFLQQMFGPSLEEIKKMQELDKTNGNPAGR